MSDPNKMTRSASTQALPTDAPAPYVEPTLTNKTKVTGNIKDGHNFMETKHISDISKLKAAAKPDDFRLSDFNLERIHRFVDEPQKNVGSNMAAITKSLEDSSLTIRNLASPFSKGSGTSYTHGNSLSSLDLKRNPNVEILEHNALLGTKARFGDGDGTYWDRWMSATGHKSQTGAYHAMPFDHAAEGQVHPPNPLSGYKRFETGNPGELKSKSDSIRFVKTSIRPYSLYDEQPDIRPNVFLGGRTLSQTRKSGRSSPGGRSSPDNPNQKASPDRPTYSRQTVRTDGVNKKDDKIRRSIIKASRSRQDLMQYASGAQGGMGLNFDEDSSSGSGSGSESDSSSSSSSSSSSDDGPSLRPGLPNNGPIKRSNTPKFQAAGQTEIVNGATTAKPQVTRQRHKLVAKKDDLDPSIARNYFGKGNGDWGEARESFYELHQHLHRQKTHFTKEQYDKLLDVQDDIRAEEDAKLLRLQGHTPADVDADEKETMRRLKLSPSSPTHPNQTSDDTPDDASSDDFDIDYLREIAGRFSQPSARTKFLYGCLQAREGDGMPPRMGPIVRKSRTVKIDLSHQGMGDELGVVFAEALKSLPYVQRINIQDNRLSDIGVEAVLRAIMDKKDVVSLIIGFNKVDGDAAETLGEYIADPECPLKELGLANADIDDGECSRFVDALATNKNLTNLDMSNNLIGSDENLNVVNPDLITGGEAIAAMLSRPDCRIKTLNLRWNLIRFNSAVEIGESLAENNSLEHLNLGYNAFGADGGMSLGQSLIENNSLKTLDIRNNNITPQAGFCIAVALRQNELLSSVDLSGNPLGEIGGKTFMSLPMELGDRLSLNLDGCNFKTHDERCWFDPASPSGLYSNESTAARDQIVRKEQISTESAEIIVGIDPYIPHNKSLTGKAEIKDPDAIRVQLEEAKHQLHPRLDMSKPYDRAVLIELIRFVAEKDGCALVVPDSKEREVDTNRVEMLMYDADDGSVETKKLERVVLTSITEGADTELAELIENGSAREIFRKFDIDGSGEIDRQELGKVFQMLGKGEDNEKDIDRVMTQFDIDGSGSIEEDEFIEFLMQLKDEISEMRTKRMFMAEPGVAVQHQVPWRPPSSGKVEFRCIYNPTLSDAGKGKSTDNETLERVLQQVKKTTGDATTMLQMSLSLMRLGPDEAQKVFDELLKVEGDRVKVLKAILPVMANPQQARVFVDINLKDKDPYRSGTKVSVKPKEGFGKEKVAKILEVNKSNPELLTVLFQEGGAKEEVEKSMLTLLGDAAVSAETEKRRLQGALGNAYYAIMGIPSGHYKLDMTKETDRMCLQKLAAINNTETSKRRKARNGDTSQKGNWMNFRNEFFRGKPHTISSWFLDPVPKQGVLEFDYVSTARPDQYVLEKDEPSLSQGRFLSMVSMAFDIHDKAEEKEEEENYKKLSKLCMYDWMEGVWSPQIRRVGSEGDKFGHELAVLLGEITSEVVEDAEEKLKKKEEERPRGESGDAPVLSRPGSRPTTQEGTAATKLTQMEFAGAAKPGTPGSRVPKGFDFTKLPKFQPGNRFSIALKEQEPAAAVNVFAKMKRLSAFMMTAAKIQVRATKRINSLKLLQQMQDMVSLKWINALQARFLVEKFTKLIGISSEDMKLKLNLVVTLHSRIVDLYNFDIVMGALNAEEQACIVFKLGWLNTWSPLKPDVYYELCEGRREERLVSKALLHLAVEEPGENWFDDTFQWNRSNSSIIPGWDLPITWFSEEGMPAKGLLKLSYYSGEGKGLEDCEPRMRLRHALCGLVLAEPPMWIRSDPKTALPPGKDPLSCAQSMLLGGGIKLNYRQKANPVTKLG